MHSHLNGLNLLDKARRHHRRAMLKDPSLAALVAGGGKILANGHLSAALPLVDGTVAVYSATPVAEWYFSRRETSSARFKSRVNGGGGAAQATPLPFDRVKGHIDAALDILAAVEGLAAVKRSAARLESDFSQIAAE